MLWNEKSILNLRLRLCWSQAEFGRRLGVSCDRVQSWENGEIQASPEDIEMLNYLENHLNDYAKHMQRAGLYDSYLNEKSLDQTPSLDPTGIADEGELK